MIRIADGALRRVRAEAERAYPRECCGLLVGPAAAVAGGDAPVRIDEAVPCANVAPAPEHTFEVDPQARIDLERRLRGGPRALVGHYHSHPDGEAWPSDRDRARAFERGHVWLIAAVAQGRCRVVRGFLPAAGGFDEIALLETEGGNEP
jgi:proteasome lid subunit RPN8/RPN11